MSQIGAASVLVMLVISGAGAWAGQPGISYDSFMRLSPQERETAFASLDPDTKATLKRTHAERWLNENRASLSSAQTALVQEAIDFVAPALYASPGDRSLRDKERQLAQRLACTLGPDRAMAAFSFRDGGQRPQPGSNSVDAWAQWLAECVW